jgi:DNA repair protein RadC
MARFTAQPRRDMKPLAKLLIKKFGSFAEVVHAPETRLQEVDGAGEASITLIKLIAATPSRIAEAQVPHAPALSWSSVIDYCRTAMAFAARSSFACCSSTSADAGIHQPTRSYCIGIVVA